MPYDSEATKARILDAAAGEFAEHGLAGARVDRIASRAQANKQAIYAYFGDKERLFTTVLRQQLREHVDAVPVDPDDIAGYMSRLLDQQQRRPELLRLLLWEALERGDGPVPDEGERTEHYRAKVEAFGDAQRDGKVRDDIDPAALMLLLLSMAKWPFVVPQVRRMLMADDSGHERLRAAIMAAADALTRPPQSQDGEATQ